MFLYPIFAFSENIKIVSNVPVKVDDLLRKVGPFYLGVAPLREIQITRKLFRLEITYYEEPVINIQFKDGIFALTKTGFLIEKGNLNLPLTFANFSSSSYNKLMGSLIIYCKDNNLLNIIKSLEIFGGDVAFVDKNGILVIIGKGDYELKMNEYIKALEILSKRVKHIKSIDLRFNLQAVIAWRENG
ncbi:hypothetical protein CSE_11770 [Caldisericum exile AZM16c01]|uniref:POTRA domain-containing protein n=1 Tax=Caldisericum exile (strain DSM 21853 / NBRC 104410 / AZM16c01) TaxID=511051 RepID=A0A7U6JFB5_CALEA|nr:hypothetical protein CSE_11770 [Caldisericum exile AZM16c01]